MQLTPTMLAELYRRDLVETSATTVPESRPLKCLGNNRKNIVVIVAHHDIPFLPDDELGFLSNVLSACKLSLDDIAIINREKTDMAELQNMVNGQARHVLLFGAEPLSIGLPINFPQFQLQPFNKRTYLYAPALREIEGDKTLKSKLWNALKLMLGI